MNHLKMTAASAATTQLTLSSSVIVASLQTESTSKTFRVTIGTTRVIYPEKAAGAQLPVTNPQDYPIIVQSTVNGEDHKTPAPYLVTPPLFRLDENQQSRLRIIRTSRNLPRGRESLFWLCMKALPPSEYGNMEGADKVSLSINMAISTCNKLLYPPSNLKGNPETSADLLRWSRKGSELRVANPTPFYLNLKSVSVGGKSSTAKE